MCLINVKARKGPSLGRVNGVNRLLEELLMFRHLSFLIGILLIPAVFGQENTAGVQGIVKDPSGAVIANAQIEVFGPNLIGTRKVKTDEAGAYRVSALPPGTYTMTVGASGFRTYKQPGITLTVGRLPNIDI